MDFFSEIRYFLTLNHFSFHEIKPAIKGSGHPILHIENANIYLHCISFNDFHSPVSNSKIRMISPDYFSHLSDEFEKKKNKLVHLWEDVWRSEKELVQLRILAICGRSKRIHARQTEGIRLDKSEAEKFLIVNHLQKYTTAYFKYGLKLKNQLVAVCTFSKSRIMTDSSALYRSYELVRYASLRGTTVTGGLSKLLKCFINEHHPAHLMTYADRDWSSGESYKKIGFKWIENTPPQLFFIHPLKMIRQYPQRLNQTEEELLNSGYIKIYNSGNAKFILDLRKN
ncbi:MAG: hypothetical protein ACHQK8_05120 [Bacteroidia bacterium]